MGSGVEGRPSLDGYHAHSQGPAWTPNAAAPIYPQAPPAFQQQMSFGTPVGQAVQPQFFPVPLSRQGSMTSVISVGSAYAPPGQAPAPGSGYSPVRSPRRGQYRADNQERPMSPRPGA